MTEKPYWQQRRDMKLKGGLDNQAKRETANSDDLRTPAKQPGPPQSAKKGIPGKNRSKIKKASKKRVKELRDYKTVRHAFLDQYPRCEVKLPGCLGIATQIHHQSGREGKKLLDVTDFLSCCDHCHRKITEQSREAIQAGHSKSRLGKPQK